MIIYILNILKVPCIVSDTRTRLYVLHSLNFNFNQMKLVKSPFKTELVDNFLLFNSMCKRQNGKMVSRLIWFTTTSFIWLESYDILFNGKVFNVLEVVDCLGLGSFVGRIGTRIQSSQIGGRVTFLAGGNIALLQWRS